MTGDQVSTMQIVLVVLNILLSLIGALLASQIKRLYQSIDALSTKDVQLEKVITEHREDVLRNYTSNNELGALRDEVFKRFDRFEDNITNAIRRIPGL